MTVYYNLSIFFEPHCTGNALECIILNITLIDKTTIIKIILVKLRLIFQLETNTQMK